MTILCKGGE